MTLNSASHTGKHPHPTTLSVGVTGPRKINNSNTSTIPGGISGRDGQTVNTLWSIWNEIYLKYNNILTCTKLYPMLTTVLKEKT